MINNTEKELIHKSNILSSFSILEESLRYTKLASKMNSKNFKANIASAQNSKNLGKYKDSIKFYDKALAAKPHKTEAIKDKGLIYMKAKKFEKAISCFTKYIEVDNEKDGYNNRGLCYYQLNQLKPALYDFSNQFVMAIALKRLSPITM
jgi:tetratricopeptide (TPR) repeat protein